MDDAMRKALESNPRYDYSGVFSEKGSGIENLIINRSLTGKGREFVINLVKAPIEKALVTSVKLFIKAFGRVTKENSRLHNTHVLLDLRDEFFQHYTNRSRLELLDCAWELLIFENEHDSHYEWLFNWLTKRIAEERAKEDWIEPEKQFPQEGCWRD